MPEINGLYPTKTRIALLRAVVNRRVYDFEGEAYDEASGTKVSARLRELIGHEWVAATRFGSTTSYRLTNLGRRALNGGDRG
jgi:hypothetical protein